MDDSRLVSWFSQHIICIVASLREPSNGREIESATGFLLRVRGRLLIVTAAHVLRNLEKISANVKETHFFDGLSLDSPHRHGIPINLSDMPTYCARDNDDVAFIGLRSPYEATISNNGKKPLDEYAWQKGFPSDFDAYYLLGIPTELIEVRGAALRMCPVLIPLRKLAKAQIEGCDDLVEGAFYGKIQGNMDRFKSVVGMSGGPIFGLKRNEKGETRFWVVAVQSHTYENHRIVEGVYVKLFLERLSDWMRRREEGTAPMEMPV